MNKLTKKLLKSQQYFCHKTFYAKDLKIFKKALNTPLDPKFGDFQFGEVNSDHMGEIIYDK